MQIRIQNGQAPVPPGCGIGCLAFIVLSAIILIRNPRLLVVGLIVLFLLSLTIRLFFRRLLQKMMTPPGQAPRSDSAPQSDEEPNLYQQPHHESADDEVIDVENLNRRE